MLTLKDRTKDRLQASMTIGIPKVCADRNIGLFSERLTPSGLGKVVSFGWQAAVADPGGFHWFPRKPPFKLVLIKLLIIMH